MRPERMHLRLAFGLRDTREENGRRVDWLARCLAIAAIALVIPRTPAAYRSRLSQDHSFALAAGFARVDDDPRPISETPKRELFDGFGA